MLVCNYCNATNKIIILVLLRSGSSDTSDGSMPSEEREHSPIRDRQFKDLQTFLSDTMSKDDRKELQKN